MKSPWLTTVAVALLACGACAEPARDALGPPLLSHSGPHAISGVVLGPDGTSICNFLPSNSLLRVRAVNPAAGPLIAATRSVFCPANDFVLIVNPGTYRLQCSCSRPRCSARCRSGISSPATSC